VALPLVLWVMIGFFEDVPSELIEAARIDGCSNFSAFIRVALPLVKPGIVATAILSFIFSWNNFLFSLIIAGFKTRTLPIAVYNFLSYEEINWGGLTAAATIITLPVLILSLFIQKHIVRGLTLGALKGEEDLSAISGQRSAGENATANCWELTADRFAKEGIVRLEGKSAIVTGAGRGIGKATALMFAREGADVLVPDLDLATSEQVAQEIRTSGRKAVAMQTDVTQAADIRRMVETALREFARSTSWVNNAGITQVRFPLELTEADWDRTLNLNLKAVFFCPRRWRARWSSGARVSS